MAYPNYGLMADMASGIKEGMIAYQTNQNINRQNQLQNLLMGVQKDPNTGELSYTPQKQQELAVQQKKVAQEAQAYDPNSEYSQNQRNLYKGILGKSGNVINDQMSASDLTQNAGLLKAKMTADETKDWRTAALGARGEQQAKKEEQSEVKDVGAARKQMLNDPDYKAASNNIMEGTRTLQTLDEAAGGNPIASGAVPIMLAKFQSGLKRINQQEINALGGSRAVMARAQQAMTELQSGTMTPESVNFMKQMVNHTMESDKQSLEDVKQRHAGYLAGDKGIEAEEAYRKLNGNPQAQVGLLKKGSASVGQSMGAHPQDSAAVAWAKANPNDPRAIKILQVNGAN